MKKLKLNLQQFEGAEVLTRSQLKKVLGGDDGGGGSGDCSGGCTTKSCSTKVGNKITIGSCYEQDSKIGCLCLCNIAGGTGC